MNIKCCYFNSKHKFDDHAQGRKRKKENETVTLVIRMKTAIPSHIRSLRTQIISKFPKVLLPFSFRVYELFYES